MLASNQMRRTFWTMCTLIRPPLLASLGWVDGCAACAAPVDIDLLMFHFDNVVVVLKWIEKSTSVAVMRMTAFIEWLLSFSIFLFIFLPPRDNAFFFYAFGWPTMNSKRKRESESNNFTAEERKKNNGVLSRLAINETIRKREVSSRWVFLHSDVHHVFRRKNSRQSHKTAVQVYPHNYSYVFSSLFHEQRRFYKKWWKSILNVVCISVTVEWLLEKR